MMARGRSSLHGIAGQDRKDSVCTSYVCEPGEPADARDSFHGITMRRYLCVYMCEPGETAGSSRQDLDVQTCILRRMDDVARQT